MNKTSIGFSSLFITGILFGTYGVWIRILNRELSTYQQIALRFFIGLILVSILILLKRKKRNFSNLPKLKLILMGLIFPIGIILFNFAMLGTKLSIATAGFYLGVVLLSLFVGIIFFNEKLNGRKVLGLLFALGGLAILMLPFDINDLNLGFVYGVGSGVAYGITNSFKKNLKDKVDRHFLVAITALGTTLFMLFLMFLNGETVLPSVSGYVLFVGFIFAIIIMLAEYLTVVGFQNYDLNLGSIVLAAELIFASLFGYFLFQESLTTTEIIGSVCILLAIVVPNLQFKKLFK